MASKRHHESDDEPEIVGEIAPTSLSFLCLNAEGKPIRVQLSRQKLHKMKMAEEHNKLLLRKALKETEKLLEGANNDVPGPSHGSKKLRGDNEGEKCATPAVENNGEEENNTETVTPPAEIKNGEEAKSAEPESKKD